MDLEIIILSEISQRKINMISLICGLYEKIIQMNVYMNQKETHRHRKQIYSYQRGKGRGDKLGVWD